MAKRPADPDPRRRQGIPRVKWVQKGNLDDATDAVFLASMYGLIADPWQVEIIHAWLARRPDGKWTHPRSGVSIPRQNGKNGSLEVRELFGLIELGEAILHTAHEIKTSRKAFKRLKHFFGEKEDDPDAKFPELNALVADVRNTNGQEAIVLKDLWLVDGELVRSKGRPNVPGAIDIQHYSRGGFIEFATRTGRGGRGSTYDLLVVDEAQHLSEEDLAAIRPVISSGPLGNSQIIYLGTPPNRDKLSEGAGTAWLRIRGSAGKAKDLAWIEYGAPDGPMPDLDDLCLLYEVNPALELRHGNGEFGLSLETVNGERADLSPADYARERFGWWGNPEQGGALMDMDVWARLADKKAPPPVRATIVVEVETDRSATSIGIAADGGSNRILILERTRPGTAWAAAEVKKLTEKHDIVEVALNPRGQAGVLIPALTKLGIEYHELTNRDSGQACGAFLEGIPLGRYVHIGQADLASSLRNATTRYVDQLQQWDRRNQQIGIAPVVATSTAAYRWALHAAKPTEPPPPPPEPIDESDIELEDNIQTVGF